MFIVRAVSNGIGNLTTWIREGLTIRKGLTQLDVRIGDAVGRYLPFPSLMPPQVERASSTSRDTADRTPSAEGYYAKWVRFARQYVSPFTLDKIEENFVYAVITSFILLSILQMPIILLIVDPDSTTGKIIWCVGASEMAVLLAVPFRVDLTERTEAFFQAIDTRMRKTLMKPMIKFIDHQIAEAVRTSQIPPKSQSMCVIRIPSGADWNKYLSTHVECANFEQFAKTHFIDLISEENTSTIFDRMKTLTKKYDVLLLQGHGCSNNIQLGKEFLIDQQKQDLEEWLSQRVKIGGIVVLNACNTGKGEDNIAKQISRACLDATIYAATELMDRVTFQDKSLTPSLWVEGRDVTCIYRNGELILSKS